MAQTRSSPKRGCPCSLDELVSAQLSLQVPAATSDAAGPWTLAPDSRAMGWNQ